jgi:threonine synthase
MDAFRHWARVEGIFAAPEGAASLAAYRKLRSGGFFNPEDKVVLFNTGSGLKYLDVIAGQSANLKLPASRQIGGLIGPY